jgi:hypothetical protein
MAIVPFGPDASDNGAVVQVQILGNNGILARRNIFFGIFCQNAGISVLFKLARRTAELRARAQGVPTTR